MQNLSIVLSTFNEEQNIAITINKLLTKECVKEIIVIDDDSKDRTIEILNTFNNPKINFKKRKNIKNFSTAFIDGLNLVKGDYILRFDLDMYNYIDYFIENFNKMNLQTDCLIFSRYVNNGKDERRKYRSLPSLLLNKACQLFLYNEIKDYTSCVIILKKMFLRMFFQKKLIMQTL